MTRSIDPILVSLAPYTAVPSTLSLPIGEPVSLASVTIVGPPWLKNARNKRRKGLFLQTGTCEERQRLPGTFAASRDLFHERNRQVRHVKWGKSFEASAGPARRGRDGGGG